MLKVKQMQEIQDLKLRGYSKSEIIAYYESQGKKPPSRPTINKYYNMDSVPENPNQNLIKDKVFDHEPFRSAITEILRKKQPEESMH
jgi:cyanate lyase